MKHLAKKTSMKIIYRSFFLFTTVLVSGKGFGAGGDLDNFFHDRDDFALGSRALAHEDATLKRQNNIPHTEIRLQVSLENAPDYVGDFFEKIFSAMAPCPETGKFIIDQIKGKDALNLWISNCPHSNFFRKCEVSHLIKNVEKLSKDTQTQLLDFLITQMREMTALDQKQIMLKILCSWPDQSDVQTQINQPQFKKYLHVKGCDPEALYWSVLFSKAQDTALKEEAISCLKGQMKIAEEEYDWYVAYNIMAMLMVQDEELNSLARKKIRQQIGRSQNVTEISPYLNALLESQTSTSQQFGRELIMSYLDREEINDYQKQDLISYLFQVPEFIDEGKQQLKKIFERVSIAETYYMFGFIFEKKEGYPEIETFFSEEYLFQPLTDIYNKAWSISSFFVENHPYKIRKGIGYLYQLLRSQISEEDKGALVSHIMERPKVSSTSRKYLQNSVLIRKYQPQTTSPTGQRFRSLSFDRQHSLSIRREKPLTNKFSLSLPHTEVRLKKFLDDAPEYVHSFFESIQFLSLEEISSEQLQMGTNRFWQYTQPTQFIKAKIDFFIKGILKASLKMKERIFDFLIDQISNSFALRILHMWPDQAEVQSKMDQPKFKALIDNELYCGTDAINCAVLFASSQDSVLKEKAIYFLKNQIKICEKDQVSPTSENIIAILMVQDEELSHLAQSIIEKHRDSGDSSYNILNYLPFLMESNSESLQQFGYTLAKTWIAGNISDRYDMILVLSYLSLHPKFKEEAFQQLEDILSKDYYCSYVLCILDQPEREQYFIDNFISKYKDSSSRATLLFNAFFQEPNLKIQKGLKYIRQILRSGESEVEKLNLIAILNSFSSGPGGESLMAPYLKQDPLCKAYCKHFYLSPTFITSKATPEWYNEIYDQLIQFCTSPDFDKQTWGYHIGSEVIDVLSRSGHLAPEKLLDLIKLLSRMDFGETVLGQKTSMSFLSHLFGRGNEEDKLGVVEQITIRLPTLSMEALETFLKNIYSQLPEPLKNQIAFQVYDYFWPKTQELKIPIPVVTTAAGFQERNRIIKERNKIVAQCQPLYSLLDIIAHGNIQDAEVKSKMGELLFLLVSENILNFVPEERMKLLSLAYHYTTLSLEQQSFVLREIKNFFLDVSFPLTVRGNYFYSHIQYWKDYGLPYGKAFAVILEQMLDFELNITGMQAMVENVHDKVLLNQTNILLKKLLEDENPERRFLSSGQQAQMLDDFQEILGNLPDDIIETLQAAAVANGKEDYIEAAKARIEIMRAAKDKQDPNADESQWYGTNPTEIVILDHPLEGQSERFINQGRALQLVYDAMQRLRPPAIGEETKDSEEVRKFNLIRYKDSLTALIEILGSNDVMNACKGGSMGGLIRAAQVVYKQHEEVRSEKFDKDRDGNILKLDLQKLKSLMISMLDHWRVDAQTFEHTPNPENYPMLSSDFIDLVTKENHVMDEFFKILQPLKWRSIIAELGDKPLYAVFQQGATSEKEDEIMGDLHTLLIIPAMRAFIYGQYKPFLINGSLNVTDYITDVESLRVLPGDYQITEHELSTANAAYASSAESLAALEATHQTLWPNFELAPALNLDRATAGLPIVPGHYYMWSYINGWTSYPYYAGGTTTFGGVTEGDLFVNDGAVLTFVNGEYILTSTRSFWRRLCDCFWR